MERNTCPFEMRYSEGTLLEESRLKWAGRTRANIENETKRWRWIIYSAVKKFLPTPVFFVAYLSLKKFRSN